MAELCPKCNGPAGDLVSVDAGMRLILTQQGLADIPTRVCTSCIAQMKSGISKGEQLRARAEAKAKQRQDMWKGRVELIKKAHEFMNKKAFAHAAVCYEKYIRVLELIFEKEPGGIGPEVFNNSGRSKEITVLTSIYWDLYRIYDNSPRYQHKMKDVSKKLIAFATISKLYPDILRKAEAFTKKARNKAIAKETLMGLKNQRGMCFIATAAFTDTPDCFELSFLRNYRDRVLLNSLWGQKFVKLYYFTSPPLAKIIGRSKWFRVISRYFLRKIIKNLS